MTKFFALKQTLLNHIKNVRGFTTKRKIVVFSVDDYGNVRLSNKKARKDLDAAGFKIKTRFDAYDTIETKEDLEILYETLTSVKDTNGRSAVFTPFAMPCNINFEKIIDNNYSKYYYEYLPETLSKLEGIDNEAYSGVWSLWQQGIDDKIMLPQFHGREHLNLKIFNEKLSEKSEDLVINFQNRSYTSIQDEKYKTINYSAAFDFWDVSENETMKDILIDGIEAFKKVFGFSPKVFMPPTSNIHQSHLPLLKENGIKFIDTNLIHNQHKGLGNYKRSINYTGKKLNTGQINLVRNVVFEPTNNRSIDWVEYAFKQVEAAFFWNKPANISSHRVNFCGYIDENNRKIGIDDLKKLLDKIVNKYPNVEFMSVGELGNLILNN